MASPASTLSQALRLLEAGKPADALAVLDGIPLDGDLEQEMLSALLNARLSSLNSLGRWSEILTLGETWLATLRERKLAGALGDTHGHVGLAYARVGKVSLSERHLRAAIHVYTWEINDLPRALSYQRQLAIVFKNLGRWHQARYEIEAAIDLADEGNVLREAGAFRANLAILLLKSGCIQPVPSILDKAEQCLKNSNRTEWLVQLSLSRSRYFILQGQANIALETLGPNLPIIRECDRTREEAICLEYMGDCYLLQRDYRKALEHYTAAQKIADETAPGGDLIPELGHRIGEALINLGDPNGAILACERGLRVARDTGDRYEECATHRVLAMANWAAGNPRKALRLASEGIDLGRSYEIPYELARVLQWSGEARLQGSTPEDKAAGRRHLWEARALFERLGIQYPIKHIEALLGFESEPEQETDEVGIEALQGIENLDRGALKFGIITCNPDVSEAVATIQSVGPSRIPVLIMGPSGVGKELMAKALHLMSDRRKGPFIAVNCGALSQGLIESEFFGHDRGAFTGAVAHRDGLIASAHMGTLFLDEIAEMPQPAQATLLRVLETGEMRPLGRDDVRRIDVRIVAATNANLEDMVERGAFRRDLYYRLNGVSVTLPALREREEDTRALFRYFWAQSVQAAKKKLTLADDVEAMICAHSWPGNVRELRQEVVRVVTVHESGAVVRREAFLRNQKVRTVEALRRSRERTTQDDQEREEILRALRAHGGNKAEAARSLGGMKRTTLIYKIERLGIRPEEYLPSK
ncbi:MAG TPA: sigma 54-interacting transcriptional regulator [Candidatus Eisenbacteria bacterium]|nr:sigma 54-interacting transcriptional regulator [Candidatus Eisenbacteria bacterium]